MLTAWPATEALISVKGRPQITCGSQDRQNLLTLVLWHVTLAKGLQLRLCRPKVDVMDVPEELS